MIISPSQLKTFKIEQYEIETLFTCYHNGFLCPISDKCHKMANIHHKKPIMEIQFTTKNCLNPIIVKIIQYLETILMDDCDLNNI